MKKTLAILLAMALLCMMAVGTTLTYFTDEDGDVNTMTVGKVDITQSETVRSGAAFVDANLYPYTGVAGEAGKTTVYDAYKMFDTNKNAIDKIVTVTLDATSEDAYVRTIFAFEADGANDAVGSKIFLNYNEYVNVGAWSKCLDANGNHVTYTKGETVYYLYSFTYAEQYQKGETTEPSLLQFYLTGNATNGFSGGSYEILAVSQAVQAQGFGADANAAFTAAFPYGDNNQNVAGWFANLNQ